MLYVIRASCQQACMTYHTPLLCIQWKTPENGHRNCPKLVEFYSKNKFEELVHLVGFIIRTYHDARSSEREICKINIYIRLIFRSNFGRAKDWNMQTRKMNQHLQFAHDNKSTFLLGVCSAAALTLIVLMWRIGWAHNNARK